MLPPPSVATHRLRTTVLNKSSQELTCLVVDGQTFHPYFYGIHHRVYKDINFTVSISFLNLYECLCLPINYEIMLHKITANISKSDISFAISHAFCKSGTS